MSAGCVGRRAWPLGPLLLAGLAFSQGSSEASALVRGLSAGSAAERRAAAEEIQTRVPGEWASALVAAGAQLPAEPRRLLAEALGRNVRLLPWLAAATAASPSEEAFVQAALREHYRAFAPPLPSEPDAVEVLADRPLRMDIALSLPELADRLLASDAAGVPLLVDPRLVRDTPAELDAHRIGPGTLMLVEELPSFVAEAGLARLPMGGDAGSLWTIVAPEGLLVGRQPSAASFADLFANAVRLAVEVPDSAAGRRAAICLGALDMPTTVAWLADLAAGEANAARRSRPLLAGAVAVLRGASLPGGSDRWGPRLLAEYGSAPAEERALLGSALRVLLATELGRGRVPAWFTGAGSSRPEADAGLAAILAGIDPGPLARAMADQLRAGGSPELCEALVRGLQRAPPEHLAGIEATLRDRVLEGACPDSEAGDHLLAALCDSLARAVGDGWWPPKALSKTAVGQRYARGRCLGQALARSEAGHAAAIATLLAADGVGPAELGMLAFAAADGPHGEQFAAAWLGARGGASAVAGLLLDLALGEMSDAALAAIPGQERRAAFTRLSRAVEPGSEELSSRARGRALGALVTGGPIAAGDWFLDAIVELPYAAWLAALERALQSRPILARDIVFGLSARQEAVGGGRRLADVARDVGRLVRWRPRANSVPAYDPGDPLLRPARLP